MKKLVFLISLMLMQITYINQVEANTKTSKSTSNNVSFPTLTKQGTANFTQVIFDKSGKIKKQQTGFLALQQPGKLLWHYQKPYNQVALLTAEKMYFFDKDLEQLTQKDLKSGIGSMPASLLFGHSAISDNFVIQKISNQSFKLIPKKSETPILSMVVGFLNQQEKTPNNIVIEDKFQQKIDISFQNWNIQKPDAQWFQITNFGVTPKMLQQGVNK